MFELSMLCSLGCGLQSGQIPDGGEQSRQDERGRGRIRQGSRRQRDWPTTGRPYDLWGKQWAGSRDSHSVWPVMSGSTISSTIVLQSDTGWTLFQVMSDDLCGSVLFSLWSLLVLWPTYSDSHRNVSTRYRQTWERGAPRLLAGGGRTD